MRVTVLPKHPLPNKTTPSTSRHNLGGTIRQREELISHHFSFEANSKVFNPPKASRMPKTQGSFSIVSRSHRLNHAVANRQERHPSFPTVRKLSPTQMEEKSQTTKAMTQFSMQQNNSAVNIVDEEEKSHIKSGEYNILSKASLTNRLQKKRRPATCKVNGNQKRGSIGQRTKGSITISKRQFIAEKKLSRGVEDKTISYDASSTLQETFKSGSRPVNMFTMPANDAQYESLDATQRLN